MDAHNDAGTPETLRHGYFDGMGVSMLNGRSWQALMSTVPGHMPVPISQVLYCGLRNRSEDERESLNTFGAHVIFGEEGVDYAQRLAEEMQRRKESSMKASIIHVDLDVLDPRKVGHANEFPSPGGLTARELADCMAVTGRQHPLALTVASFMPGLEGWEAVEEAAITGIVRFMENIGEFPKTSRGLS